MQRRFFAKNVNNNLMSSHPKFFHEIETEIRAGLGRLGKVARLKVFRLDGLKSKNFLQSFITILSNVCYEENVPSTEVYYYCAWYVFLRNIWSGL